MPSLYASWAPEHLGLLRLVTKLANESGSMTATMVTDGYSMSGRSVSFLMECFGLLLTGNRGGNLVDVILILGNAIISDGEFTVGSQSGTVTVWKIVDDNLKELL